MLGMTDSASTMIVHSLHGDHSGLVTIRNGQRFDLTKPRTLMPTSLLALPDTDLYLPTILDCKNVDITIYGKVFDPTFCFVHSYIIVFTFVSKALWYRTFKKLDCSLI